MVFSPDGKKLTAAGFTLKRNPPYGFIHTFFQWDLSSGTELTRWQKLFDMNDAFDCSPDGKLVANAEWQADAIALREAATGREIRVSEARAKSVH